ncbi:unnamed protein product [Allacma fusca]|uniref:Uncharacterized protein n=1 Tax=Allacma fusca TaxID=39272 RepID=A0A8J2L570_9HEXA|nr:unnamed protein product [Allacma fusca]
MIKPSDMFITSDMISVLILFLMWQSQMGTCPKFAVTNRYSQQLCKAYSDKVFGKGINGSSQAVEPQATVGVNPMTTKIHLRKENQESKQAENTTSTKQKFSSNFDLYVIYNPTLIT